MTQERSTGNSSASAGALLNELGTMLSQDWIEPHQGMRLHNFTLLQKIGEGAYAVVWKAHDLVGSRDVAIKVFRIPSFDERNRREAATRFVSGTMAMRRLENEPTVIKIFEGPHVTGCHLWFAMEYAEDGSLYQALASNSLTISDTVSYTHLRAHETRHDLVCRLLLE